MDNFWNYIVIAAYILVILFVGVLVRGKHESAEGYLLGGRKIPFLAAGLSMMMAALSSISLVQVPGEIYNHGWTYFSLHFITFAMSIPSFLLFVPFYFKLGSFTPFEYLEYRYDKTIRSVVAITGLYGNIMYLGMVLYTTSKIFEGAYGWHGWITILLIGTVSGTYTLMGGMKAEVWADVIQFFVLLFGLLFVLYTLNSNVEGGLLGGVVYSFENGHGAPQYRTAEFYKLTPYIRLCFWLMLWGTFLGPLCGNATNQGMVQKILATGNLKAAFKSQLISTGMGALFVLNLWIIGFAVFAYYGQNPDPFMDGKGGDLALFHFISSKLATPIPGLFMAAILAAVMSTMSSGINSVSMLWLKEIHGKFINKNMDHAKEIFVAHRASFSITLFAILFALALDFSGEWLKQSATEVGTLFYMLGSMTVPAFLFAVLSKRANATLIWGYTLFATGESVGRNFWYALSRKAVQIWEANPAAGFGWGGKLNLICVIIPALIGLLLCAPWLRKNFRPKLWCKLLSILGITTLGLSFNWLIWWCYSNACITDRPLECSFAFDLPISIIMAFIILFLCPVQPEKKWRGLTIFTVKEKQENKLIS